MTDVLIVSEDQAEALEKAGIKVEIQYIVKLSEMLKSHGQAAKPQSASAQPVRSVRYGSHTTLRWTGLKWSGTKNTQPHVAHDFLRGYFENKADKTLKRSDITALLVRHFLGQGVAFNASIVTQLCNDKYLVPVS